MCPEQGQQTLLAERVASRSVNCGAIFLDSSSATLEPVMPQFSSGN
jgi:hypothetical protein